VRSATDDTEEVVVDNREALRSAGLIADTELPAEYYEVIDSMEPAEVEALLALKQRLVDAGVPTAPLTAPVQGNERSVVPF
jgi:hypothetical protein